MSDKDAEMRALVQAIFDKNAGIVRDLVLDEMMYGQSAMRVTDAGELQRVDPSKWHAEKVTK